MTIQTPINADPLYAELVTVAEKDGAASMLTVLAESLRKRKRWHALFDLRLMQARLAFGLSLVGDTTQLLPEMRQRLDERSLEACREVGWPLLEEGHVAAGWIYLRAAVEPAEIQEKLRLLAARVRQQALDAPNTDALLTDEKTAETVQEMINLALWEGVDPALGLSLLLEKTFSDLGGTPPCAAILSLLFGKTFSAAGIILSLFVSFSPFVGKTFPA